MTDSQFLGMLVTGLAALVGLMTAVLVPVVRLSNSITKLNEMLKNIQELGDIRDRRINAHAHQLDDHEKTIAEHEVRLQHLEN